MSTHFTGSVQIEFILVGIEGRMNDNSQLQVMN